MNGEPVYYCGGCGIAMSNGDHSRCLPKTAAAATRGGPMRRTAADKLEKARELANDMARDAAVAGKEAMERLARYSQKLNQILDGEWT